MSEQAGLYKVDLFENLGVSLTYTDADNVLLITNTGQNITLTTEENLLLNYINNKSLGENNQLMNDYEISGIIFDLSTVNLDLISSLGSIFGWIAVLYFRNGETKILKTPLFIEEPIEFDPLSTHKFDIKLINQEKTFQDLLNYG